MTNLLFIVPARGGSKRLPGKNTRLLNGKSLLGHIANAVSEAGVSGDCLLTTDDPEIAEQGRALGWLVPFLRPAELARDDSPTEAAIGHAMDWYDDAHDGDPDLIMVLQPTSPMRTGRHIADAVSLLEKHPDADAVLGVKRLKVSSAHIRAETPRGFLRPLGTQNAEAVSAFVPNGAIYLVRSQVFRATGSLAPENTLPLEMSETASIDIDTSEDWCLAEAAGGCGTKGKPVT